MFSGNQELVRVLTLAAVMGMLALSSPLSAALSVTSGGFDAETMGNMPGTPFTSPLGTHAYSQAHNTAWMGSGNLNQWAAGVNTPANIDPVCPAAPSSPNVAWLNENDGTQTQTLGGTMDPGMTYTLSFKACFLYALPDMTKHDLVAIVVGSVDGTLAQHDFAEEVLAAGIWYDFSVSWVSAGLNLAQTVTIAIGAATEVSPGYKWVIDDVAISSEPSTPLSVTTGGFDAETMSNMPGTPFTSPLGTHAYSQAHNTAWMGSGNLNQWAAGVNTPANIDPVCPAAPSSPNVAWLNENDGTQTQTLGGTMDPGMTYTLSFKACFLYALPDMTKHDLVAIVVGSVDGTLAQHDFAEEVLANGTWYDFSVSWDSTGLNLAQPVTIAIGAATEVPGAGHKWVIDDVAISSMEIPPVGTIVAIR